MDTFEEHVIHCKELLDFKYMHDFNLLRMSFLIYLGGSIREEGSACELFF